MCEWVRERDKKKRKKGKREGEFKVNWTEQISERERAQERERAGEHERERIQGSV